MTNKEERGRGAEREGERGRARRPTAEESINTKAALYRMSAASYSASKWVHYRGLMSMLGLRRSAVLCNMLKLMRCNKWANPPKACPIWQKHKTFRQAWWLLWVERRPEDHSESPSASGRHWTWLIVRDGSPASSTWAQEVSLWEVVSEWLLSVSESGQRTAGINSYLDRFLSLCVF